MKRVDRWDDIRRYLDDEMPAPERATFEAEVAADAALADDLRLAALTAAALDHERDEAARLLVRRWQGEARRARRWRWLLLAVAVGGALAWLLWRWAHSRPSAADAAILALYERPLDVAVGDADDSLFRPGADETATPPADALPALSVRGRAYTTFEAGDYAAAADAFQQLQNNPLYRAEAQWMEVLSVALRDDAPLATPLASRLLLLGREGPGIFRERADRLYALLRERGRIAE